MECPICFTAYDDNERKPVQTFCRCHQHLCLLCLRQLVKHFTYCPWDRTRWSGRQLLQKFLDTTPPNYLQLLNARKEERGQKRVEEDQEEVDVEEQRRLLEIFALVRRDRDFALHLQQCESAQDNEGEDRRKARCSNKRKRDLLSFYSPSASPAAKSSSSNRAERKLEIDESPWNCRYCSFLNHGLLQCCELCDALRQGTEELQWLSETIK